MARSRDTADVVAGASAESDSPAPKRRRARGPDLAVPPRDGYIGAGGTPQTSIGGWWEHHPVVLRIVTVAALVWGGAWLTYRIGFSWRGANPVSFVALVLVEAFSTGRELLDRDAARPEVAGEKQPLPRVEHHLRPVVRPRRGTEITTESMPTDDARDLIRVLREMAIEIGAIEA